MIEPYLERLWKDPKDLFMDGNHILTLVHKDNLNNFNETEDYYELNFFDFTLKNKTNRKQKKFFYLPGYIAKLLKIIRDFGYDTEDLTCFFPKSFYPCFIQVSGFPRFYFAIAPNTNQNPEYEAIREKLRELPFPCDVHSNPNSCQFLTPSQKDCVAAYERGRLDAMADLRKEIASNSDKDIATSCGKKVEGRR
jgi:hypothetical protein